MTFTKPQQHSCCAQRREILHKTEEKLHQCVFLCSFCASSNDWGKKIIKNDLKPRSILESYLRVLWRISHHWNGLLRHTNSHTGTLHFHIQEPLVRLISFTATNRWSELCSTWLWKFCCYLIALDLQSVVITSLTWITGRQDHWELTLVICSHTLSPSFYNSGQYN